MIGSKRSWSDLTDRERTGVVAAITVQLTLMVAALADLRRRPAEQVNGDKRWWAAASLINFVGPLAYFAVGRRGR